MDEDYYECDIDWENYDTRDECEENCEGGDCDHEVDYDYRCELPGGSRDGDEYGSENTCEIMCKHRNCADEDGSRCESNYCSDEPDDDGKGVGACWW